MLQKLLETLESDDNEIKLKSIFVEARDFVANQIAEDLAEYRHKRTLGLGSLYGEQKLTGTCRWMDGCVFIHPSIRLSIHPFIHASIHASIHPSIHLSIHPSIHPYIYSYIR